MNDLSNGDFVVVDGDPYQILEVAHLHIGRGGSSIQTKIKNLRTGQVFNRNFKPADFFEEAEIEKTKVKFLYSHRGEFWFTPSVAEGFSGKQERFSLKDETMKDSAYLLKPNLEVTALKFNGVIINIILPVKVDYKVTEAPPAVRGNTAQGGTKMVAIEGGAKIMAPLFINEGDVIRINTETGEYVERVEKG